MKIAVVMPGFGLPGKGGAEKGSAQVANLLANSGMSVDMICRARGFAGPSYPLDKRVALRPVNLKSEAELKELSRERYDLMVAFGMGNFFLRIPHMASVLEAPFLVQECVSPFRLCSIMIGHQDNDCPTAKEAFWLRQAVYAHAAAIRFNQPAYVGSLVPEIRPFAYGFYNSLWRQPGSANVAVQRPSAGTPKRKIICVGGLRQRNKNGMAAVQAFVDFAQQKSGWSFCVYGANTYPVRFGRLCKAHPEADIIECGVVENIDEIYRDAYALVIPSFSEGMPNVVIEAFSYGVPCIGFSDCAGVRDIIAHEVTGLLADRSDPNSLTDALLRISDPDLRNTLGRNAKEFAEQNLEYDMWARNWLRMVENACAGRDSRGIPSPPPAHDPANRRAASWRALMQSHLASSPITSDWSERSPDPTERLPGHI
jgi:glycosyltransferase involved in cell wall biosynthesis